MRLITLKQGAPPVIVLTAAELQVVYYVSLGWLDKEIATRLGSSLSTVKSQLQSVFDAGFRNRSEVIRWAVLHPEIFAGCAVGLDLHLHGCECGRSYCVTMRSVRFDRAA